MKPFADRNNLSIFVPSCDRYADVWPHFFHLFHKYWPNCPSQIFLGSNHMEYRDPKVTSLLIGSDTNWAESVQRMVKSLPTQYFLFLLEDFFLQRQVETSAVWGCFAALIELGGGYMRLRPFPKPDEQLSSYPLIGSINVNAPYRLSLQAAIWKKDVFLKLLQPGETAWDMEIKGSKRSENISEGFYCTWKTVIQYRAGITLGKWSPVGLTICEAEKMKVDFTKRARMTSFEIKQMNFRNGINTLVNIFPWKFRKTVKQLFNIN